MFPPCSFAGHCKPGNRRFCRLTQPAKLVHLGRCQSCPHAGSFSTSLEPICTPPMIQGDELPCVYRGGLLRMDTVKVGCCGTDVVPVNGCEKFGECTESTCFKCAARVTPEQSALGPMTGPANLMMFVYPKRETREVWSAQLEMIAGAMWQFDGKKVLAIAADDSTDQTQIDRSPWDEIIEIPNDPQFRELAGWRWAMERLKDQPGFTIRLHAKGAWRGTPELHLHRWWQLGFERLLDVDAVRESLQTSIVTGPFRRNVPSTNLGVPWHYAGSLYAFRNDAVFSQPWEPLINVAPGWYVEAWPGRIADKSLAGSLGWDGVGDLYNAKAWHEVPQVDPAYSIKPKFPPPDTSIRHLIFHCYPKKSEDWRAVCFDTFRYCDVFTGRIIVSITTGMECDDPQTVRAWFSQFGEIEFTEVPNVKSQGINTTFREQLRAIRHEPGIVFKSHTKGISHAGDPFGQWRDNMATGCLSNMDIVRQKFAEGYRTFGVYKTVGPEGAAVMGQDKGPTKTDWPGWHFPGAFHWFDPRYIPERFFKLPLHHYENEAFACHLGPTETAFSLKPSDMLFVSSNVAPYFAELRKPITQQEIESRLGDTPAITRLVESRM